MTLREREAPDASPVGLAVLGLSVVIMPLTARASRRVARALGSRALETDAAPTSLCAYLCDCPGRGRAQRRTRLVAG